MEKNEKTVEQLAGEINQSIDALKKAIGEKADLSALETKYDSITAKLDGLIDKDGKPVIPELMVKQQEQLDEISTQLKQLGEYQKGTTPGLKAQVFGKVKSDDFRKNITTDGIKRGLLNFDVKAANIDTDDINSGTIETQTDIGVSSAPWRPTPLWDAVAKGTIGQGRDSISWWEETTRTDSAEMVTEQAAPSKGSAKTWTKQSMDIKMIKDYTKVSRSALEDFEYITSEIQDLMQNGIPREREAEILSGSGLGTHLKGIDEYYKAFACPANFTKVAEPNEGDVLAAAILQVMNGNTSDTEKKGYLPNLLVLNPGDSINMRLLKNANYSYVHHPLLSPNGDLFKGVRIVESLDLAAGQFIVGDFSRAKAYVKRAMSVTFHYENEDDVLNDLVLVLASMRIAGLKVTTPDAYAFVGGTFAAAKALIASIEGS